jgi:hypothetical protein
MTRHSRWEQSMQTSQRYTLTIHDLFTVAESAICGAEAEVAILDGDMEIDRMKFSGKCQSKGGCSRSYYGKPGLAASKVVGPGRISFHAKPATGFNSAV